jgi:L-seryl-tRNA(Ser) seleniumtransferase
VDGASAIGGGALPDVELPTVLVRLAPDGVSARELEVRLRKGEPHVVARLIDDRVCLDLRTVIEGEEEALLGAVRRAIP